jgi:two-component system, OmpR family, response regulator
MNQMTTAKTKILLAEDDENLGLLLKEYLNAKGFETKLFANGDLAFRDFVKTQYDICILDVMMPVKDGYTLAREIKQIDEEIPIIFLTAKSMKEDVIEGFSIGADDYITKPFSMEELLFRIEAILKRTSSTYKTSAPEHFNIGRYVFDVKKQSLQIDDNVIRLTTKESELLKLLCTHQNKILDRNFALKTIWLDDNYFNARSMDVYITKLRKYLKEDDSVEIINVHGKGFKLIM